MLDSSARLLRLLSVLQSRREWAGAELAERLSVTPRTVRRDVERLRALGYPVHATPGWAGGYRLEAGAALPPLLLDDDEAVAVAVGLRTAAGGTVAGIEETSLRALAKLEQVLPARLRGRVNAFQASTVALTGSAPAIEASTLALIAGACRDAERLRFGYRDRGGRETSRRVEPHRLVHTGRRWYLVARDEQRQEWRSFRVDRIADPVTTGRRFIPQDPPDAASYISESVSTAPYRYRARVRLHAPVDVVADRVPPTVAQLVALDEGTCLLTSGADSLDAIVMHLALLDVDFEVLEPDELAARVLVLARRLARAGGGDEPAGSSEVRRGMGVP